eukprot:TRINITY_DN42431_c0_g1_i1.p1 TRINITY_DN42431_c0_g1~~TRINITY_DN42431_c0_g1_i1.p1  ORF type:complete len:245 (+),score=6.15 TRINITY_DN42431_c0_g1_i1:78-737(+)
MSDLFISDPLVGHVPSPTTSSSSLPRLADYECTYCADTFDSYDKPVEVRLPGTFKQAILHRRCRMPWCRENAKKCDFCKVPMITEKTTLSGGWGVVDVHPECVKGFECANGRRGRLSRSTSKHFQESCEQCKVTFRDGETASLVTLPGETRSVKLHPDCAAAWTSTNARRCKHCKNPMSTEMTTLTGPWGNADIHPTCIQEFYKTVRSGRPGRVVTPPS